MTRELPYAASKAALHGITASLAAHLAPRGILVNTINPGPTDTGWATPELIEQELRRLPLGRWGAPEDAARLVGVAGERRRRLDHRPGAHERRRVLARRLKRGASRTDGCAHRHDVPPSSVGMTRFSVPSSGAVRRVEDGPVQILLRVARASIRHRTTGHAAEMAFFAVLTLVPSTIAVGAALGPVRERDRRARGRRGRAGGHAGHPRPDRPRADRHGGARRSCTRSCRSPRAGSRSAGCSPRGGCRATCSPRPGTRSTSPTACATAARPSWTGSSPWPSRSARS